MSEFFQIATKVKTAMTMSMCCMMMVMCMMCCSQACYYRKVPDKY